MASHRPNVPGNVKRLLIDEVGNKCANPGCPNRLLELHHIKEWHVYQTHDAGHMIALCAACHDSVDRGALQISDYELYSWKGIPRTVPSTTHLFIEPGDPPMLVVGSVSMRGDSGLVVFDLSERHRLSFVVKDEEILLLNVKVSSADGRPLVDVVDGYVRQRDDRVEIEQRPGHIRIPMSLSSPLIPEWVRTSLVSSDPLFATSVLSLLDLRVIEPGVVKVEGIWIDPDKSVVITNDKLSFLHRGDPGPLTMVGAGRDTILNYVGPVGTELFRIL